MSIIMARGPDGRNHCLNLDWIEPVCEKLAVEAFGQGNGKQFANAGYSRGAALDLVYAPPFAPVWDPVLVAANQLAKEVAAS